MRYSLLFIALVALPGLAPAQENAKDQAIKKDRKQYVGTWRVTSLEVNGNKSADDDARKITVVNQADGGWGVRVDGTEIAKGMSIIDPTKTPKTIDFTPTVGLQVGEEYLGIYEITGKTRRLCFAPPGQDRPRDFAALAGSERYLVVFERETSE